MKAGTLFILIFAMLCSGCGSIIARMGNDPANPRYVYVGVRADVEGIIYTNKRAQKHFSEKQENESPVIQVIPNYPARIAFGIVDLPFSTVCDTLLFPFEGMAALSLNSRNSSFSSPTSNTDNDRGHH